MSKRSGCTCDRVTPGDAYKASRDCPHCWAFWHREDINRARGGDGNVFEVAECDCNGKCDDCKPADTPTPGQPAASTSTTPAPPTASTFTPRDDDPPTGVVVGVYKWPALTELQIRTIRETCGPVPICISNDNPDAVGQVEAICKRYADVFHWPNPEKIGHTGGDISAFFKAGIWGQARGLRVVAKLSQRFIVTRPRWIQDGARELLESGLSLGSQKCTGTQRFDLRTEAVLLDLETWSRPEVLSRIMPRRYWNDSPKGLSAETVIARVLKDLAGEFYHPWSLFGEERAARRDGYIWHNSHTADEYRTLAASRGIALDADFHVEGWQRDRARGAYSYG